MRSVRIDGGLDRSELRQLIEQEVNEIQDECDHTSGDIETYTVTACKTLPGANCRLGFVLSLSRFGSVTFIDFGGAGYAPALFPKYGKKRARENLFDNLEENLLNGIRKLAHTHGLQFTEENVTNSS